MTENNTYNPSDYFDYATMSAVKLISAQDYQRDIKKVRVNKIVKEFDPYKVNPIKVAYRSGKYYVFDGQHTLSALVQLFGVNIVVPVMIFKEVSHEIEALLFASQDENKQKLGIAEKLLAEYIGGKEEVIYFKRMCELYGFECDFKASGTKDRSIVSYGYLYNTVYKKHGSDRLARVLEVVSSVWNKSAECTYAHVLKGVNCFIGHYDGEYNKKTLIKALDSMNAAIIKTGANNDNTRKGDERYAAQIVAKYNSRCKSAEKLAVKF